jgi:exosortase
MDTTHSPELLAPAAAQTGAGRRDACLWIVFMALVWLVLCRVLSSEWEVNEQYSYGWFVPLFSIYLFWMRWPERPAANPRPWKSAPAWVLGLAAVGMLLLVPLRLFEVANPEWRPLQWLHALIAVGVTLMLLWLIGGRRWVRNFAFPVGFILVAVPWLTPFEVPIVQGLQRAVAVINTELMNLMGIPAQLEGSLLRLRTGVVGVNEACSGVRSLQTSIMAGLLFGELHRMSWKRRIGLLAAVVTLAFVANVMRGGFLVWTAAMKGPSAVADVHDMTGMAVLGAVMLGTFAFANLFRAKPSVIEGAGKSEAKEEIVNVEESRLPHPTTRRLVIGTLIWLMAVEVGVEGWYRLHERDLIALPAWSVRWPEKAPAFKTVEIDELTRNTLRYDDGGGVSWKEPVDPLASGGGSLRSRPLWMMYFFRWESGQTSVLRAKAHRPDICLVSVGWVQTEDRGVKSYSAGPGLTLPFRHFAFAHSPGGQKPTRFARAFYCVQEDQTSTQAAASSDIEGVTGKVGGWAASDRVRMVEQGRRNRGQQVMEVLMVTEKPLSAAEAEAAFEKKLLELVHKKR